MGEDMIWKISLLKKIGDITVLIWGIKGLVLGIGCSTLIYFIGKFLKLITMTIEESYKIITTVGICGGIIGIITGLSDFMVKKDIQNSREYSTIKKLVLDIGFLGLYSISIIGYSSLFAINGFLLIWLMADILPIVNYSSIILTPIVVVGSLSIIIYLFWDFKENLEKLSLFKEIFLFLILPFCLMFVTIGLMWIIVKSSPNKSYGFEVFAYMFNSLFAGEILGIGGFILGVLWVNRMIRIRGRKVKLFSTIILTITLIFLSCLLFTQYGAEGLGVLLEMITLIAREVIL